MDLRGGGLCGDVSVNDFEQIILDCSHIESIQSVGLWVSRNKVGLKPSNVSLFPKSDLPFGGPPTLEGKLAVCADSLMISYPRFYD